jgi:hypothetical protein
MSRTAVIDRGFVNSKSNLPLSGNTYGDYFLSKNDGIQYYWSNILPDGILDDWVTLNVLSESQNISPFYDTPTVVTTNAAPTTLVSIPVPDDAVYLLTLDVVGIRTDVNDRGGYRRAVVVYRSGGPAIIEGIIETSLTRGSNLIWDVVIEVSGNNALVIVTGAIGSTIKWHGRYTFVRD